MGRRKFFAQLVNPTTNEEWLNTEYDMTEELLSEIIIILFLNFEKFLCKLKMWKGYAGKLFCEKSILPLFITYINQLDLFILFIKVNLVRKYKII